jgi:hypothetical protein
MRSWRFSRLALVGVDALGVDRVLAEPHYEDPS